LKQYCLKTNKIFKDHGKVHVNGISSMTVYSNSKYL
jgi:hypothetical protein